LSFATYHCENGHDFEMLVSGDVTCTVCGSTSEKHLINNGGLGRIFYISYAYNVKIPQVGNEDWPDLSRTAAAIEAFDESGKHWMGECAEIRAVGEAFAADTADRNSADVAPLIRPGPRVPNPGAEPSFVRRCVARWVASRQKETPA